MLFLVGVLLGALLSWFLFPINRTFRVFLSHLYSVAFVRYPLYRLRSLHRFPSYNKDDGYRVSRDLGVFNKWM